MEPGRAYGFFHYEGMTEDIVDEMSRASRLASTPSELEVHVDEAAQLDTVGDQSLSSIASEALQEGMSHVLLATYPSAENRKAADELGDIFRSLYTSPLYAKGEEFRAGIVYHDGNDYVFKSG